MRNLYPKGATRNYDQCCLLFCIGCVAPRCVGTSSGYIGGDSDLKQSAQWIQWLESQSRVRPGGRALGTPFPTSQNTAAIGHSLHSFPRSEAHQQRQTWIQESRECANRVHCDRRGSEKSIFLLNFFWCLFMSRSSPQCAY